MYMHIISLLFILFYIMLVALAKTDTLKHKAIFLNILYFLVTLEFIPSIFFCVLIKSSDIEDIDVGNCFILL